MGAEVNISSVKYYNQFKNGDTYSTDLGEFTTNLAGSTLESVKVIREVDIEWNSVAENGVEWRINETPDYIERSTGDFRNDGIAVGDTLDFISGWTSDRNDPIEVSITVTSFSGDGTRLYFTIDSGAFVLSNYDDAGLRGTNDLTALFYSFGIIENSEPFNIVSKVSGNDQVYFAADVGLDTGGGRPTTFTDMTPQGSYRDWVTGSAKVRYVSNVNTYIQRFEVEHIFRIVPFYLEGELSNLQDNILPDLYAGISTLKQAVRFDFRTALGNPNTSKIVTEENILGSVAWFDENFNGLGNDYNIVSIAYKETVSADVITGIDVNTKTTATITVERLSGAFSAGERFGTFVSFLPVAADYTDKTTDLETNFILADVFNIEGAGSTSSDFITALSATISAGDLVITCEIDYSNAQQVLITEDDFFLIGVMVGDESLVAGSSDRVMLLADAQQYIKDTDIAGLMAVNDFDIFMHDDVIPIDSGFTDITGWNEDGVAITGEFGLDLSLSAVINTLDLVVIAFKTADETFFELDSFSFDIAGAVVSAGVQQLEVSTDRGYILDSTDQFNEVTLTTGGTGGGLQLYTFQIGQKIRWEDWLANLEADTVFFDGTKPNDNLNFKTSNYSELSGYEIRLGLRANLDGTSALGESGNTDYLFLNPKNIIFDYGQDGGANVWSSTVELINEDTSVSTGGIILSGQDTRVKITWDNSGGAVVSLTDIWAINRIQEENDGGQNISECSSLFVPVTDDILKPISGETKLKLSIVGGDVVAECLIDGSLVEEGISYNISGTIRDVASQDNLKALAPSNESKETTLNEGKITAP